MGNSSTVVDLYTFRQRLKKRICFSLGPGNRTRMRPGKMVVSQGWLRLLGEILLPD